MRVAVLADTHWKGSDAVPEHVLNLLSDAELVIHAGDLKCEKVLASLTGGGRRPVKAVRGNNFELDFASLPGGGGGGLGGSEVRVLY